MPFPTRGELIKRYKEQFSGERLEFPESLNGSATSDIGRAVVYPRTDPYTKKDTSLQGETLLIIHHADGRNDLVIGVEPDRIFRLDPRAITFLNPPSNHGGSPR